MPISEAQVRTAKSAAKAFKLYDSEGLFLLVTPSGGKLWRLRFKFDGKEKLLTLGAYPKVGLAAARKKRNAAIEDIQAGIDPAAARAVARAASAQAKRNTFKSVALEWHQLHLHEWTPAYAAQILKRLEADVFPKVGDVDIGEIKPAKMLEVLKAVEARGVLETNRRLKQYCSAIFRFGIASQSVISCRTATERSRKEFLRTVQSSKRKRSCTAFIVSRTGVASSAQRR